MTLKTPKAVRAAVDRYQSTPEGKAAKNRQARKSTARGFIKNQATAEELRELQDLILEKLKTL